MTSSECRALRTATSKNLIVRSLLLTTTRGSALLSCEPVRLSDVRSTELLIDLWSITYFVSHCFRPKPASRRRGEPSRPEHGGAA